MCGFSRITKRNFWSFFKPAWFEVLLTKNVHSAFAMASIEFFDFSAVFDFIDYDIPLVFSSDGEISARILVGLRDLCRQIKVVKQTSDVFTKEVDSLLRVAKKLLIKNEILEHENAGFRKTLIAKQKH